MKAAPAMNARREAGFTLVELMIALVIGLVLTLVIAELFVGSRRTFATTDDVSRMQENIRFVTNLLSRTVHQAGYKSAPNTKTAFIFGTPNLAIDGTAGAASAPDSLTVLFQGSNTLAGIADGTVVNCRGQAIAAGFMSINVFTVETFNGAPTLVCRTNPPPALAVDATPFPIVGDVDNMKILYGEDTNADGSVDRFVPRGSVADINAVVALRIAMLFRSANVATNTALNTTVYSLHGQPVPAFNDTRARRDVVFTAGLRNRSL